MSARRQWTMAVCAASLAGPAGADPAGVGLDDSGLGFRSAWEGHGAGVEGSFESMLRLAQATAEEVVDGSLAPPEGDASGEGAELPTGEELAEAGAPKTDLAAAAQNPIASTIRLPFESNLLINSGEDNETGFLLNIQPVLPMSISEAWNIIHRPIIPIMYTPGAITGNPANPGLAVGFDDTFGLGDINYTPFFSPKDSGEIIWGVGPSLSFPTATDDVLGSGSPTSSSSGAMTSASTTSAPTTTASWATRRRTSTASPTRARCSPTPMRSRAARPAGPPSSSGSIRSAPAC
jgi:hypothetical protein